MSKQATVQQHFIHRQVLELVLSDQKKSYAIQNEVINLLNEQLLPQLDNLFSSCTDNDHFIHIDKFQIDLGTISYQNLEKEFVAKAVQAIEGELKKKLEKTIPTFSKVKTERLGQPLSEKEAIIIQSKKENGYILLKHFLLTGSLPWWAEVRSVTELENKLTVLIENEPLVFLQWLKEVTANAEAVKRLAFQFSQQVHKAILELIITNLPEDGVAWLTKFGNEKKETSIRYFLLMWVNETEKRTSKPAQKILRLSKKATELLEMPLLNPTIPDKTKVQDNIPPKPSFTYKAGVKEFYSVTGESLLESTAIKTNKEEAYFIQNSGLVLLVLFLPALFEQLRLLDGKKYKDKDSLQRAVLLTQYLVTGDTVIPEHLLPLNKIICGMNIQETLPATLVLSREEEEECNELLQQVISYWKILGNTSVKGLREGFLQRSGTLQNKNKFWLLRAEQKPYDILLEKIPWNYKLIVLPWSQIVLQVEW